MEVEWHNSCSVIRQQSIVTLAAFLIIFDLLIEIRLFFGFRSPSGSVGSDCDGRTTYYSKTQFFPAHLQNLKRHELYSKHDLSRLVSNKHYYNN